MKEEVEGREKGYTEVFKVGTCGYLSYKNSLEPEVVMDIRHQWQDRNVGKVIYSFQHLRM